MHGLYRGDLPRCGEAPSRAEVGAGGVNAQVKARFAVAAALLATGLALAACSPEPSAEAEDPTTPAPAAASAPAEDCDCRRSVKTPLENPIKPAGKTAPQ